MASRIRGAGYCCNHSATQMRASGRGRLGLAGEGCDGAAARLDPLVPRRGRSRLPFQRPGLPSPARRRQNLPQRRRNTYFIFELENGTKPYDGNDGCPPSRRDPTEVRCAPTESESHLPGRSTSCAREPLAPHGPRRLMHSRRGPSPFLAPVDTLARHGAASLDRLGVASSCQISLEGFTRRRREDGASVRPNTVITPELTGARRPPRPKRQN